MTSTQFGTDSAYGAVAPYRLYLQLSDVSTDDLEFMTLKPSPLTIVDVSLKDAMEKSQPIREFVPTLSNTIYGHLMKNPQLKSYLKFVQQFRLQNYLNGVESDDQMTVFIPVADMTNF